MTHEALDEVVFDYLEGNLTAEEKEAFEVLMNESEVTTYHVKLWQNTYVAETLPSVEALEQRLLRPVSGNVVSDVSIWQRLLMMLVMTSTALIFQNTSGKFENSRETVYSSHRNEPITKSTVVDEPILVDESECPGGEVTVHNGNAGKQAVQTERGVFIERFQSARLNAPDINTMPLKELRQEQGREFVILRMPAKISVTSSQRRFTAAERRAINKRRRDEEERRKAMKFLKGNVPYVVPLKSNNF
jgi:hypothetical protein